ncbi:MAG: DoxX family protein [Armatimonadota bacterium]|nr:DoxX family protein [Armatimonadota bacterium]
MTVLVLIAQLVLGIYFLMAAWNHLVANRQAFVQYAQARGVPSPSVTVPLTGLMHLGAGLSLLLGYQVKIGAWLAIIFLVLAAFLVHHFWTDEGMEKMAQMAHFTKNLALAAALLLASLVAPETWVIRLGP